MWLCNSHWQPSCREADLPEMRDNDTITRRFMRTEISFALGKNGGYIPSSLGGRWISVGRLAVRQNLLQFDDFNLVNSKA